MTKKLKPNKIYKKFDNGTFTGNGVSHGETKLPYSEIAGVVYDGKEMTVIGRDREAYPLGSIDTKEGKDSLPDAEKFLVNNVPNARICENPHYNGELEEELKKKMSDIDYILKDNRCLLLGGDRESAPETKQLGIDESTMDDMISGLVKDLKNSDEEAHYLGNVLYTKHFLIEYISEKDAAVDELFQHPEKYITIIPLNKVLFYSIHIKPDANELKVYEAKENKTKEHTFNDLINPDGALLTTTGATELIQTWI